MTRRALLAAVVPCFVFSAAGATLPRQAPDFTIEMNGAPALKLSQFRGKPVVLTFILTTCSHCQRTTGYLVKLQNELGPRGIQVLECAIEQMAKVNIPGFVRAYQTPFPVGYNLDLMSVLDFLQHPPMTSPHMPLLAFIDRQGMIREQHEGNEDAYFGPNHEQNLRASMETLLKEAPAARKGAGSKQSAPKKTR